MGTLLFVVSLMTGAVGLALLPLPATRQLGRHLCKYGFMSALVLLGAFMLLSLATLPFD